jgi:hypothetical protein
LLWAVTGSPGDYRGITVVWREAVRVTPLKPAGRAGFFSAGAARRDCPPGIIDPVDTESLIFPRSYSQVNDKSVISADIGIIKFKTLKRLGGMFLTPAVKA